MLAVEDDDLVHVTLTESLLDAGFRSQNSPIPARRPAARRGRSAGCPQLDINLGSPLNGFDVAATAHSRWPSIAVILISGLPVHHSGRILDPRDRYLQKSVSNCHLLQVIQQMSRRE
jgi:DNA-binding response OmpR family regulator